MRRHLTILFCAVAAIVAVTATTPDARGAVRPADAEGRTFDSRDVATFHTPINAVPLALVIVVANYPASKTSYCSGTPIAGTSTIVTAAHCFGDGTAISHRATVVVDGTAHTGRSYRIHPAYRPGVDTLDVDVAVITVANTNGTPAFPDGARISTPTGAAVTLAGYQSAAMLHPSQYSQPALTWNDHAHWARGCRSVTDLTGSSGDSGLRWAPCGLRQGASGGPVLEHHNGVWDLVGVIVYLADTGQQGWVNAGQLDAIRDVQPTAFFRG